MAPIGKLIGYKISVKTGGGSSCEVPSVYRHWKCSKLNPTNENKKCLKNLQEIRLF